MKITIDTKDDSHEDIRKVIALLSKMIESENSSVLKEPSSESTDAFANMFGNIGDTKEESKNIPETSVLGEETAEKQEIFGITKSDEVEEIDEEAKIVEY